MTAHLVCDRTSQFCCATHCSDCMECVWYAYCIDRVCMCFTLQELGPWCATAVLRELLRPRQTNNLLDTAGPPENKYADDGPDSAAIKKTPGAYITNPVGAGVASGDPRGGDSEQHDADMTDVFPVNKPAPITPEIQALNVALKEVARMLAQALPISKRLRLASSFGKGLRLTTVLLICVYGRSIRSSTLPVGRIQQAAAS